MDLSFRFDLWYARLPKSPRDEGRVAQCVLRTGPGARATVDSVEVEPGRGVLGDAWERHADALPGNEVALMNVHVLRSLVDDPARMELAGDNLLVDLDITEANLPVGTRLHIGDAVLVISPEAHRPCAKFVERFGASAAKKVARANRRGRRGRGVLCTVERGGRIAVGDTIRVLRERPS